jgi:spermidine/putrescine-binding protein
MNFKHIPAFLMGGAFALMASISMAQAEKLVISNWDGYMPKDIAESSRPNRH